MQESIAIIVTSVKEGWGLIVTEANANGTIAITYNADGLRDANSNKTGYITEKNTPGELAGLMKEAIDNPKVIQEKSEEALKFSKEHANWEKNVGGVEGWMKNH
jgi:glycosyltransferase involved in cell wall biosynthesis